MQKFFQGGGGKFGVRTKEGGAEAYVRCYTLHLLGGARMTQGGGKCPSPPPLKYSPANAPPRPPLNTALQML